MSRFIYFFLLLPCWAFAQSPQDLAIPLKISTGINPPAVLLSWPNPQASDLLLRRRVKGQAGNTWVDLINAQSSFQDGYFDFDLSGDESYEYSLLRTANGISAQGFAFANFFKPAPDTRGKLLVFIDSTTADQLGADLILFKNDIRSEGWQTVPTKTGPYTTVQQVKNKIVSEYNADPNNVKAVLLIGSVPVPYSGSMAWDNKPDHTGAWPCDAYYGDVNGVWTDNIVNVTNTARAANRNVPGDGKFDQSTLPSAVELPVGRLDFRRLSAATFGANPVELLRKYMLKNHLYRTGQLNIPKKAIVDDHLGWSNGEAFAADGYRNAYPLMDASEVQTGDFLGNTNPQRFLLGYAAGTSGNYTGANGIGTSANMASDTIHVVFSSLFGDYFGDWDFETNPLMPSVLASKGSVLAVQWAGKPRWMQHGLASGESIGYCLKETQNAQFNDAYGNSSGESGAHITLLGDPTLRAQVVKPVSNLVVSSNCNKVSLHWTASPDPEVLGYIVYRAFNQDGPYARVSTDFITQTFWDDLAPVPDTLFYVVRAMKLEIAPGGGAFYNTSSSPIQSTIFVPGTGPTAFGLGGTLNCIQTQLTLGANFQPPNSTWQWYKPNGEPLSGFTATEGGVYTVIVTAPNGCTVAAYATVNMDTIVPPQDIPGTVTISCSDPTAEITIPPAFPGGIFKLNGVEIAPGTVVPITSSIIITVISTYNGCSDTYLVNVADDFNLPVFQINSSNIVLDCDHANVTLQGNANLPVTQYLWSGNGQQYLGPTWVVEEPGNYCCTITAANGCTASDCETVVENNEAFHLSIGFVGDSCSMIEKTIQSTATGGTPPYSYSWTTGASTPSVSVPASFQGQLGLTVVDANGCISTVSITIASALSLLAITDKPSSQNTADGSIDLLIAGGLPPYAFQWSNGSTTEDITGLVSGVYTVTVTSSDGCSTVLSVPLITVGTQEASEEMNIQVSPNPATEQLQVLIQNGLDSEQTIQLRDINGRIIEEKSGRQKEFLFETRLLNRGTYVLWVNSANSSKAFKVLIANQ
jgi:hypothetical protein